MSESERPGIVGRIFGREQAYWTAIIFLVQYNLGLMFLGWALLNVILRDEVGLMYFRLAETGVWVLCTLGIIGVVLHAANNRGWIARWCFLFTVGASMLSMAVLLLGGALSVPGRIGLTLLIAAGGYIATSMHIEHGRQYTVARTKE